MTVEEEPAIARMTSHQDQSSQNAMASGDYNNSIAQQQQPPPSSLQLLDTFEHIMANPNSSLTMTPSIVMATNTNATTSSHTSSDNNSLEHAIAGTLVTCRIEKNEKFRKKDGSTFETWILIDDQNRRYSQQKKNVLNIFQCTANVSTKDDKNKKCKGSIRIPDSHLPKLEELKKDPGKNVCTFTVGNAHEKHLPSKRGRQSSDTESEISSTSGKRKKKT